MANDDWDIFDNEIQKAMIRARRISQECVKPYIRQLAIYKRALELAVREIVYDSGSYKLTIEDEMQDYLDQAKKELGEQYVD